MNNLSREVIFNFLKERHLMTAAFCSDDKQPHTAVLLYLIDKDFNIFFVTHADSRKIKTLIVNDSIAISVWEKNIMSVQVEGEVIIHDDEAMKEKVIGDMVENTPDLDDVWPPVLSIRGAEYVIGQIKPKFVIALDVSDSKINEYERPFTKINFESND